MTEFTEYRTKYINLLTDYGFKRVFGNEEVMAAFLNDLLEPESKICTVIFSDKEMTSANRYEREVIYDMRCQLEDGSEIIVEMQKKNQEFFADRILYYLSRSISSQGSKGKTAKPDSEEKVDWNFRLKPVYGIFFTNFTIGNLTPSSLREVGFYVKKSNEIFCDKIKAYTIELPEYRKNKESDCKDKLDCWTYIINNMENLNSMPFKPQMPIFGKIENLASTAAMTSEEYRAYQDSVDAYRSVAATYEFAKKEARKEGREEGREQERIANARAMKASGYLTDEQIADILHMAINEVKTL